MVPTHESTEVIRLADQLERSFRGGAWHGPAVSEVAAGIDATVASQRVPGSTNTILDLVRHITFWLDAAYLRIFRGDDVDADADWKRETVVTEAIWSEALTRLESAHARLHAALLELDEERLDDAVPGADPTVRGLLLGILQHNAYHTGQMVEIARELRA
jgi:uncharacterized damage-inducible protein DinB